MELPDVSKINIIPLVIENFDIDAAHVNTRKSLRFIKSKHPIIQYVLDKQLISHTRILYPYHCCTIEEDEKGAPLDHINFVTYYSLMFAMLSGLSLTEQEAIVIAASGHDYFRGPGHEIKSAEYIVSLMSDKFEYSDDNFIRLVEKGIIATRLIKTDEGRLLQSEPTNQLDFCIASADLDTSIGSPWDTFINNSMNVRKEDLNITKYDEFISLSTFLPEIAKMENIFMTNCRYKTQAAEILFPYMIENTLKVTSKLRVLKELYAQEPGAQKPYEEWETFMKS